jgi:hypothetical protein
VTVFFDAFVVFQDGLKGVADLAGIEPRVGRREWGVAGAACGVRALAVGEEGGKGDAASVTNEEIGQIFDFGFLIFDRKSFDLRALSYGGAGRGI